MKYIYIHTCIYKNIYTARLPVWQPTEQQLWQCWPRWQHSLCCYQSGTHLWHNKETQLVVLWLSQINNTKKKKNIFMRCRKTTITLFLRQLEPTTLYLWRCFFLICGPNYALAHRLEPLANSTAIVFPSMDSAGCRACKICSSWDASCWQNTHRSMISVGANALCKSEDIRDGREIIQSEDWKTSKF